MARRNDQSGSLARSRVATKRLVAVMGLLAAVYSAPGLAGTKARGKHPARGDRQACVDHYYKAKESIQAGRLLDAKETLSKCARVVCGSFLQQECTTLYTQMENDVPSVVPVVVDADDTPGAAFEVRIDGELLTSKLDGISIPVNPGWHELTFSSEGRIFAKRKILLAQGQRNQAISVSQRPAGRKPVTPPTGTATTGPAPKGVAMQETDSEPEKVEQRPAVTRKARVPEPRSEAKSDLTPEAKPEARSESGASWAAYALGSAGLVGIGGAGLFTYWGRKDNMTLRSSCAPDCNPASAHHIRMMYLAADVSGAVGVAALVASTWLFLHSNSSNEKPSKEIAVLRMLDVRTSASGTVAAIGGTF